MPLKDYHLRLLALYATADVPVSKITLHLIHFVSIWYRCVPLLAGIAQTLRYWQYLKYLFLAVTPNSKIQDINIFQIVPA